MNDKQKLIQEKIGEEVWKHLIKNQMEKGKFYASEIQEAISLAISKCRKEFEQIVDEVKKMIKEKKIIELGCSECYSPNHLKVPFNCGCDCHKFALLDIVKQKLKEMIEK